ncbi:MAG: class I SAM-dependent methyltransferase [Candidatus Limnocylindrales bacterium]
MVDRPTPAAAGAIVRDPAAWPRADLRWDRAPGGAADGRWAVGTAGDTPWAVDAGPFRLELRPTTSGQVGCYPEQAVVWRALVDLAADGGWRVLNLFAHTGGATLTAAASGAAVTHVDAARTVVAWARRNAALSSLSDAPVRWIVDDAATFAARELRRGRRYDAVLIDPPAYGHGPAGRRWELALDLPGLLETCVALGGPSGPRALILSTHAPGVGPAEVSAWVRSAWPGLAPRRLGAWPLDLEAPDGRVLPAGAWVLVRP